MAVLSPFGGLCGVRRDWWQVGSVRPCLFSHPSVGKLLISPSPFPFLQQDKHAEFIYYSRLGHRIVMNCAIHWTRKIFICKDFVACFFSSSSARRSPSSACQPGGLQPNVNLSERDILIQISAPWTLSLHSCRVKAVTLTLFAVAF